MDPDMITAAEFLKWMAVFHVSTGGGTGPFLTVAGNLSDVANTTTSFENIGLGRPGILVLTDADFAAGGGTYTLTNPPPTIVSMDATTAGRVLQLPPCNQATSLQASQQIELITGTGSQSIGINNGAGTLIFSVAADSAWRAIPNNRSTLAGAWVFSGEVQTINGSSTGNVVLTLQDIYNASTAPQITGSITFFDGSISSTTIDGSITTFKDTAIPTEGTTFSQQSYICDTSSAGNQQAYAFSAGLWADSGGDLSGFSNFTVLDDGAFNTVMYMQGSKGASGPRVGIGGQNSSSSFVSTFTVNLPADTDPYLGAVVQFDSLSFAPAGVLVFPRLSTSDIGTIPVTDNPVGLAAYDTVKNVISYYDSSQYQDILTLGHVIAGTNMSIVNNGDGTMTFNSSGGSGPQLQDAASYIVNRNSGTNSFIGVQDQAINVTGGFVSIYENNMSCALQTVGGLQTPAIQNLASGGTRWINMAFYMSMSSVSTLGTMTATIYIKQASGPTIATTYIQQFDIGSTIPVAAVTLGGLVPLAQNDYAYVVITSSGTSVLNVVNMVGTAVDTTTASLASTDVLTQGSSNLYLSTDGGTTYENLSGSATIGHYAAFNTVGGQLTDSGVPVGEINVSQVSTNAQFYLPLINANTSGTYAVSVGTGISFDPSTNILSTTGLNLSGLANASSIVLADGSMNLISTALANGQIFIGSTGFAPVAATLTAGNGMIITNAAGSITLASTGNPPYTEVTLTSQSMAVNNEYTANNAGLVTLTLPATANPGDMVIVNGKGAGGWTIAQNSGQLIHYGSLVTTTGTGGSLSSTAQWNNVKLKCVTANTTWVVQTSQGNLSVV